MNTQGQQSPIVRSVTSHLAESGTKEQNFKKRQQSVGRKQVGFFVPVSVAREFQLLAAACRENPDLIPAARSLSTGHIVSLDK